MRELMEQLKYNGACEVSIEFGINHYEVTVFVQKDNCKEGYGSVDKDLITALQNALQILKDENKESDVHSYSL